MDEKVLSFIQKRNPRLCVISTVSPNSHPESAVVGYAVTDNLEIIINTNFHTRKWHNLKNNTSVALIFGWSFDELNVQYEGVATLIELENKEFVDLDKLFFSQNPEASKFKSPDTRFIKVKPSWLRLMNPTVIPPTTEEKTF